MIRTAVGLFVCALIAKPQDVTSIIQKVTARYKTLEGYSLDGSYETISGLNTGHGYLNQTSGKFRIEAVQKSRKLHVEYDGPGGAMTIISNGSTTWTYLPREKAYAKVDAVASDADPEEEQAGADNSAMSMYQLVVRTYAGLDKLGPQTELGRDQEVKTADGKIRCWVLVTKDGNRTEKNWVDQQRYLVLRSDIEIPTLSTPARIAFSLKRFDTGAPGEDEFTFDPPNNVRLVDELALPGRPAFVGKPAADFVLRNLDGETMRLSDLRGKIVVLDFWATWCPPCRHELPTINKLAEQLRDKDVVFLGINDEGAATVKSFNKKHEYTFTTLEDTNRKVHRAYQASAIPSVFVIGRDGVIRKHFVGSREEPELLAAISAAGAR
ncbi:MAG TPA: redoxin domain-containing protein [Bryobacteraceae bacterium]|jgi:peroxiredoxin/outer membrane lipoprotein-sorting protein|nr:redoxin domain-containing protein [Bryobacteraceae bacterium]